MLKFPYTVQLETLVRPIWHQNVIRLLHPVTERMNMTYEAYVNDTTFTYNINH